MEINYRNVEVLDYINIDERGSATSLIKSYNSLRKEVSPVYNITDDELTNLTKYVFYIELELFGDSNIIEAFRMLQKFDKDCVKYDNPNVFIGDVDREDYDLDKIQSTDDMAYQYHVLIDTNSRNYKVAMSKIRKSWLYVGEYIHRDISTEKIVVILHSFCKSRIELCKLNHFDKLYPEGNCEVLTTRLAIAATYFTVDYENVALRFTEASAVLAGVIMPNVVPCEAERLINELGIDCPKTIRLLYERHGYPDHEILR